MFVLDENHYFLIYLVLQYYKGESMIIDYAKIYIEAGKGGNGASSFRREKYRPKGGPDGGNGGRGGNVYFIADINIKTLIDFKYKRKYKAESGQNGMGNNKTGRSGDDLFIKVPIGTVIKDVDNGVIGDLVEDKQKVLAVKGGDSGRGNACFKSSVNQAPDYAELGLQGEKKNIILELKILADIALVGLPNAGKSTLLSVISAAKPKIADYPFTTLEPNLGVVRTDAVSSFTVADIPGLIEDAHNGAGLGLKFLRHIERTKFFLHLIDINSEDIIKDFETINNEIKEYKNSLKDKKQLIVITKTDTKTETEIKEIKTELKEYFSGIDVFEGIIFISAVTKKNVKELIFKMSEILKSIPDKEPEKTVSIKKEYKFETENLVKVKKIGDGQFEITGDRIEKMVSKINVNTSDGLDYFNKLLKKFNIVYLLKKAGAVEGDWIYIKDKQFEYLED
jgi:GTP-binding protein